MFLTNLTRMTLGLSNFLAVPLLVAGQIGCTTAPVDTDGPFSLFLRARTTNRRSIYFELSDGQLAFAAGKHAVRHSLRRVTTLTTDQLQ